MGKDILRPLEQLNLEYLECVGSPSYSMGRSFIKLRKKLKNLEFWAILRAGYKRYYNRNALKKIKSKNNPGGPNWNSDEWEKHLDFGPADKKIAIYTCVTGRYDKPLQPYLSFSNVDYIFFTDDHNLLKQEDSLGKWIVKPIPEQLSKYNNATINRYIKFHPFELFECDYDYAIYIDGNLQPVSDLSELVNWINSKVGLAFHEHSERNCIYEEIKVCKLFGKGNPQNLQKQGERYAQEKYPKENGLLECNVIVTDLKNARAKDILCQWWDEFMRSESGRDQIALPYILWKNQIPVLQVATLGHNVYRNPKIRKYDHNV